VGAPSHPAKAEVGLLRGLGWPSDYHMFRARRAFENAGLHVVPRPFPDVQEQYNAFWNREYCVVTLASETGKIIWYWWKGWLSSAPSSPG
jgi:hypothetical protein